jgi:hypothetical protein
MASVSFKQQEEETRLFFETIADKTTNLIRLAFAIYKENNKIDPLIFLNKNEPLPPSDAFTLLKQENAWFKNKERQKSVLWKFAENQEGYNIVIVDDIQQVKAFKEKDHFLLWQTSTSKFQAAFLLDKYIEAEDIKKVQKALISIYGGDKPLGASHYVRVPGFYNTKYLQDPPLVKLCYIGNSVLSAEQVLRYYRYNIEPKEEKPKDLKSLPKLLTYKEIHERKKDWWHFYNIKGNKSDADFAYTLYLMHFNLSDEEIKQILLSESDDIENRKRGHLEDYLNRTVNKARILFRPYEENHEENF